MCKIIVIELKNVAARIFFLSFILQKVVKVQVLILGSVFQDGGATLKWLLHPLILGANIMDSGLLVLVA